MIVNVRWMQTGQAADPIGVLKMLKVKVENMTSSNGNTVPNQFEIFVSGEGTYFQSYNTVIALRNQSEITIDTNALSYSNTTSKYLYRFLGMNRKEILAGIADGSIKQADMN